MTTQRQQTILLLLLSVIGLLGSSSLAQQSKTSIIQTVNKADVSLAVTSSKNPAAFLTSVTFSATVPASATGTIHFFDGATEISTGATINSGNASLSTASLSVGAHSITATYSGDANFNSATSPAITETITKGDAGLTISASPNPSTFGTAVVLTAGINSAATGSVTFFAGAVNIGTGSITAGKAVLSISTLAAGSHLITAQYAGDSNFLPTVSAPLVVTVNKAIPLVALASSKNPSAFNDVVTFTASLPADATGTVTFFDGTTTIGTPQTVATGGATIQIATLATGTHSITAQYSGDPNYTAATSAALSQAVNKSTATLTVVSDTNPASFGAAVKFTASLPTDATGSVDFFDGATKIGTGTIAAGKATLSTSALSVGAHPITAQYAGDSNYKPATSAVLNQAVGKGGVTITAIGAPNPSVFGQIVTITITVVGANGVVPTGTVSLDDGGVSLGAAVTLDASGKATFATGALNAGSHTINVLYNGDGNYF